MQPLLFLSEGIVSTVAGVEHPTWEESAPWLKEGEWMRWDDYRFSILQTFKLSVTILHLNTNAVFEPLSSSQWRFFFHVNFCSYFVFFSTRINSLCRTTVLYCICLTNITISISCSFFPSSSSLLLYQYGKTDEMAITLAQSLGQNIGIFSDKKRILNGA